MSMFAAAREHDYRQKTATDTVPGIGMFTWKCKTCGKGVSSTAGRKKHASGQGWVCPACQVM